MKVKNVKALSNGLFEVRVTVNGKRKSKYLRAPEKLTERQLEKWLETERTDFERQCTSDKSTPLTFAALAEMWLDVSTHQIRETTRQTYKSQFPRLLKAIGHIRIDRLTTYDIQVFINDLAKSDLQSICNNNKSIISNVCKLAKSLKMIDVNPAETVCLPKETRTEKEIYSREEMRELLSLLENCGNPQLRLFANLAAYTGMRTAEILGLEWCDIDFNGNTIRIHQQLIHTKEKGLHIYDETKNGKVRTITIPKSVIGLLADWKKQRECDSGMVFIGEDGGLMSKTHPRNLLQSFCKRNGIRYCSPHSFRHWHVTTLHKDGIDVAEIARRVGDEIATVLKIYLHAEKGADV